MGLRRRPPGDDVRRVRAISNNLRGTITNKTGRIVQYESFAERSLFLRLDHDLSVRDYASQPETLSYTTPDGRSHTYTPDVIVWYHNHQIELHEVTLTTRTELAQQQARMRAAREICRLRNWRYVVHTERTLPQGAELSNLLTLIAYRPSGYANRSVQVWLRSQPRHTHTFGKLVHDMEATLQHPSSVFLTALYHEIWHCGIDIDWQQMLLHNGQPTASMPVTYGSLP